MTNDDWKVTLRLACYNGGGVEEIEGDGYHPVVCCDWRMEDDSLDIVNGSKIAFPTPEGDWGTVDGVIMERGGDRSFFELDESRRIKARTVLSTKTIAFEAGNVRFEFGEDG